MNELENYLKEYRELTLSIGAGVSNNSSKLNELVEERKKVLQSIQNLNPNKNELAEICESLNIINLEKEVIQIVDNEKKKIKNEMMNLKKRSEGNQKYLYTMQKTYIGYSRIDKKY